MSDQPTTLTPLENALYNLDDVILRVDHLGEQLHQMRAPLAAAQERCDAMETALNELRTFLFTVYSTTPPPPPA